MSHSQSVTLFSNVDAATTGAWVNYSGGRSVLVVQATTYPTTLNFQYLGPDGNAITLNASTINADSVTAYDLPAGQYRMVSAGGTSADIYAVISRVVY